MPYDLKMTYDAMLQRCYYDYLRLVVPMGSQLLAATSHSVPGEYLLGGKSLESKAKALANEAGKTIFGQFFVVEYGQKLRTRFEYDLPIVVREDGGYKRYTFFMQKQPGTEGLPARVTVVLPKGARPVSAMPRPEILTGAEVIFDVRLDTDRQIQVVYAPGN
jgi:hypothetical protein